ncbi:hypothetical protein [Streptomyces sp. NPDC058683]|uniref:hypothetical protein n=1 Tax=Streptomyces sp. NPDC058683 TaxID=3346597 RepID=UPI0036526435
MRVVAVEVTRQEAVEVDLQGVAHRIQHQWGTGKTQCTASFGRAYGVLEQRNPAAAEWKGRGEVPRHRRRLAEYIRTGRCPEVFTPLRFTRFRG